MGVACKRQLDECYSRLTFATASSQTVANGWLCNPQSLDNCSRRGSCNGNVSLMGSSGLTAPLNGARRSSSGLPAPTRTVSQTVPMSSFNQVNQVAFDWPDALSPNEPSFPTVAGHALTGGDAGDDLYGLHPANPAPQSRPKRPKLTKYPSANSGSSSSGRSSRVPHSLVEKRYRENLNSQFEQLRSKLPEFRSFAGPRDTEEVGGASKWPSKAVLIAAAIRYISQLEQQQQLAATTTRALQLQVTELQKLVHCDDCAMLKYMEGLQMNMNKAGVVPG